MPRRPDPTEDQSWAKPRDDGKPASPGLVAVWSGRSPALVAIEVGARARTIGRDSADVVIDDRRLSRRHVEVTRIAGGWRVRDLGSHNGTFVDGVKLAAAATFASMRVLRVGDTLLVPRDDVRRASGSVSIDGGVIVGPTLAAVYRQIAAAGATLHITGETGTGKELAARWYHASGPTPDGPFVAVNCAAIPAALADGLLFGARKGAYSGADADRDGYLVAAHGGTLFLDEIAELAPETQAKLLRAIESRQVMPLGATQPRAVELRLCTATHRDLRELAAAGALREDLYYRINRPAIELPPLRERVEDLPYLVVSTVGRVAPKLGVHPSLVEQVLMRPWPGNARELVAELADAAARAVAAGADRVASEHLDAAAGLPIGEPEIARVPDEPAPGPWTPLEDAERRLVEEALRANGNNIRATARALGLARATLYRKLAKYKLTAT